MLNASNDSRPARAPGSGEPGGRFPAARAAGQLSRRRLIGAAGVAGLGAAVLDPAAASARQVAAGQPAGPATEFSPATVKVFDQIIASGAGAANLPGINVGVWVPGRGRYLQSTGTRDLATQAPMQLTDHLRIASISKTFTATAILQLADEKRLKLDDRLARYVPGIPYGKQITIEQLLAMTSGIYDYTSDPAFVRAYVDNPLLPFSLHRLVKIIQGGKPLFRPGTSIAYDNSAYYLLGAIAEKVSGQPLTQLIADRIARPLGLHHTLYPATPAMPRPFSRGYLIEPAAIRDVTESNPNVPGGAGAMISTLSDLKVWAKALAVGTLLTPATQARRLTTKVLAQSPKVTIRYGLGIANFNGFLGHDGAIFGYGSCILYLPRKDATIVVLGNACGIVGNPPALFIALALAAHLFPEQFPRGI
jgi:D-alanyl-D-alanine carboxypeptidase